MAIKKGTSDELLSGRDPKAETRLRRHYTAVPLSKKNEPICEIWD
jgi:hypothetical protein